MKLKTLVAAFTAALLCAGAVRAAEEKSTSFENKEALAALTAKGDVSIDEAKNHEGGAGGALKVGPKASVVWPLTAENSAGKIEMWVFEDTKAASKPKAGGAGALWGLVQKDGSVLVVGALYARYLSGDATYSAGEYKPGTTQKPFHKVQYLGLKRNAGWHKWTFDFDARAGLKILYDGRDVNARRQRFDWNKTQLKGITGITVIGDTTDAGQVVWIDDVTAALAGAPAAAPTPPPPPPPVTPEKDPAEPNPARLLDAVKDVHPRVLFGPKDIPAMRAFANSPAGKPFMDKLLKYLGSAGPPTEKKFLTNATDAQRQGYWRLPTIALHYVLTGDQKSLDRTVAFMKFFLDLPDWDTSQERNSGMGHGNILCGAALAFDMTYDELDPALREAFRKKLILQARRQYHGGHLMKGGGVKYWQNDPANNHRWHRNAGLVPAVVTAYDGNPEYDWILTRTYEEAKFIADWLPDDGTCHESSSYMIFGGSHLMVAMQAADNGFGTKYLQLPYFKNHAMFRLHVLTPGLTGSFHYGDSGGVGGYNNYLFKVASIHGQKDAYAALMKFHNEPANDGAFWLGWMSLVWAYPPLTGGDIDNLPKNGFYDDLGMALLRDGWEKDNVGAMFKCGPYGGHKLNKYRNDNDFHYINVAHNDPDANSFTIYAGGDLIAETSRYSSKKKLTSSHNTVLVNGKGQRMEGSGWMQPYKGRDRDMTGSAYVTAWKEQNGVAVVEGEAGGSYPDLSRYRRAFIWVEGRYILILDDLRAPKDVEFSWLVQGKKLNAVDAAQGRYALGNDGGTCPFQVVADAPMAGTVGDSTADRRGQPLGWRQIQLKSNGASLRIAGAFDPWGKKLNVAMRTTDPDNAVVTVTGAGITDTWTWKAAADAKTAATLTGKSAGGSTITVDASDAPKVE